MSTAGAAAATGDGDIMMRFLPSYAAVLHMQQGHDPDTACRLALQPIVAYFPSFSGGLICVNMKGEYGGASHKMRFTYSVRSDLTGGVLVISPTDISVEMVT